MNEAERRRIQAMFEYSEKTSRGVAEDYMDPTHLRRRIHFLGLSGCAGGL